MNTAVASPEQLFAQARLHHVLCAMSAILYGSVDSAWRGDGYVYHDGCGNTVSLAWDAAGVVALVFDHESERSEFDRAQAERDPLRWLPALPARLADAAARAVVPLERCVTAGVWATRDGASGASDALGPRAPHRGNWLYGYTSTAEAVLFGPALRQSWLDLASLSDAHGRLALRVAAAPPALALAPEDDDVLLVAPTGEPARDVTRARRAAEMFAQINVLWRVPEARITQAADAERAAIEARVAAVLGAAERALFEAARADRADDVRALLARGACVDARTVEAQWAYTPAGDTPLIQALKARAFAAARALVDAGADLALANAAGQRALHWVLRQGDVALLEVLLARGADPNVAERGGDTPLHTAAFAGNARAVDVLLAAGADRGARRYEGRTPAECAASAGHLALVARLSGG